MFVTREEKETFRFHCYNRYGHYCTKARHMGKNPVPFHEFKQEYIKNTEISMASIVEILNGNVDK